MIRKIAEKNNKKADNPIFLDKKAEKNAENTQFFDENTRASEIRIHCKRIITRCQERHKSPLTALKTRVFHPRDRCGKSSEEYSVSYAAGESINPDRLSRVGIGFLPISKKGNSIERWRNDGKDWETTYGVSDWKPESWWKSYGIQIFTGIPSGYLTSLDFEYEIIRDHPQPFLEALSRLCQLTENPLLVISKSGGLRFECRTPGYIHPRKDQRVVATWKNHHEHKDLYLEIFGEKGLSRYDARYEIYTGSLLNIPVIVPEAILEIVEDLREQIGEPQPEKRKTTATSTHTHKKRKTAAGDAQSVNVINGLPDDITWIQRTDGSFESRRGDYACQVTKHRKSHGAAQYYKQTNGHIDAFCHNCQQSWIVKRSDHASKRKATVRLSHILGHIPESAPLETVRKLNNEGVSKWLRNTNPSIPEYQDVVKPMLQKMMGKQRIPLKNRWHSEQIGWWNCAKGSWSAMRKIVRDRIKQNRFMLVLTGGAGGGKSTAAREHLKNFADVSPTTAQADEKYDDALRVGRHAMRHRSRNYNRDLSEAYTPESVPLGLDAELGCVPCAYPDLCNALAQMGGSPVSEFCKPHCPRFEECTDYAYLSQWRIFRDYDEIYLSYQDDIFSDPLYAGYIEQISGNKKNFVLCLDEADPASLPPERGYVTDSLKRAANDYDGFESGEFLNALLRETSTATKPLDWTNAVKSVLDVYDNDALNEIDQQLRGIPVSVTFQQVAPNEREYDLNDRLMYMTLAHVTYRQKTVTCAILRDEIDASVYETCTQTDYPSVPEAIIPKEGWIDRRVYTRLLFLETFCRIGFGSLKTADDVLRLPHRYRNLTVDLRGFIESVNSDTPAAKEEKINNAHVGWTFYLRPDMNARRGILISASGGFNEIQELYSHTDIIIEHLTTPPVEWKHGNRFFQLSTGRYTPKSALFLTDKRDESKIVGITDRCRLFLKIIHTEAERKQHQTLVVVPKPLTAEGELSKFDEVKALCELENVEVINHWHAEGTNRYTGVESIFILHYEPSVDEIQSIATRIHRNETLSFERKRVNLEKAGVKLQGVYRYTDPRVQAVFDRECEKRIYQTLMRGRQMLDTGVACYVYLFTAEPISGLPVTPILFEIQDLKQCHTEHGTLRKLEEYLASKSELSVEELAEKEGVSERWAYAQTAEQRKQTKAENDAELLRKAKDLLDQEYSQTATAKMIGISRRKLNRILQTGAKLN